jgi:hypothetical protein
VAATDGEITRALNALVTTLNDQKVADFNAGRFGAIVLGALGGQRKLEVHRASPTAGFLKDLATGEEVAGLKREKGAWEAEMLREARSSRAYVPDPG